MRLLTSTAAVFAVSAALAGPASAAALSPGFFGVMANGPFDAPGVDLVKEGGVMRANGVRTIRLEIAWPALQPYANLAAVPSAARSNFTVVGGIPTNFAATDARIAAAARNNLAVTALVLQTPHWAASNPSRYFSPPRSPASYGRFLTTLIGRYGPEGSFWRENPELPKRPLRAFQIWNEPNLFHFFPVAHWQQRYVKLLRAAYTAIKAADRGATVITAGLPNVSWPALEKMFAAGMRAKGYFDAVAIHPFTLNPRRSVMILDEARAVLDRNGARATPLWVTEITWTSGLNKAPGLEWLTTTEQGQAAKVDELYRAYARSAKRLKLARAYWYTWVSSDSGTQNGFEYAGLMRANDDGSFVAKPALAAYRRVAAALTR